MSYSIGDIAKGLISDALRRRVAVVSTFIVVSVTVLLLGLGFPKKYVSYSTIYIDDTKSIQPFLQNQGGGGTEVRDRKKIAKEIVLSRKVLREVQKVGGWETRDAKDQESLFETLRNHTQLWNVDENLVRIEYSDSDPNRAYLVVKKLADSFISEIMAAKIRGGEETLRFIEEEVGEYLKRLVDAERKLTEFRAANPEVNPEADIDVRVRIEMLRGELDRSETDLKEAQVRKASLEQQVRGQGSGPGSVAVVIDPKGEQLAAMQAALRDLRARYRDDHPDIVSLKIQIGEIERTPVATTTVRTPRAIGGAGAIYDEWRRQLVQTDTFIKEMQVRLAQNKDYLEKALARNQGIGEMQAKFVELRREYETNQASYKDLLMSRENARVSLKQDKDQSNLTFQIHEPAQVPVLGVGLRFLHFLIGGLAFGAIVPIVLLFGLLYVDPRIRMSSVLQDRLALPVVGVVPHYFSPIEWRKWTFGNIALSTVLVGYLIIYGTVGYLRFIGAI